MCFSCWQNSCEISSLLISGNGGSNISKGAVIYSKVSNITLANNIYDGDVIITGNNSSQRGFNAFSGKGVAVGGSGGATKSSTDSDNKNNVNYGNVSVSSNEDINTTDSRLDLNSSNPKT